MNQFQNPQANQNPSNQDEILKLWSVVKNSNNPYQAMQNIALQNPQVKQLMESANSVNDLKSAFYALAQKQGKDPNAILSLLK